jgi:hypothetical protein
MTTSSQSLRWVLTDGEASRLAHDDAGARHPWRRPEPWFVRLRRAVSSVGRGT